VPLAGVWLTNSQSEPALWVAVARLVGVGEYVMVGIMKMTVAVGVGVSEGIALGTRVNVGVSVGGGDTKAVWVCAAPAVATTIVWMTPGFGVGFVAFGEGSTGKAQAKRSSNVASGRMSFLRKAVFMIVHQEPYLDVKTNCTEQKFVFPTLRDHLML